MGVVLTAPVLADNTGAIPTVAYHLPTDGTVIRQNLNGTGGAVALRWYVTTLKGGRSYSIHASADLSLSTGTIGEPSVTFFNSIGAALGGVTDTSTKSPQTFSPAPGGGNPLVNESGGHRFTYTSIAAPNADEIIYIRVAQSFMTVAGDSMNFRISVQETTLYGPWFYTDANYESYVTIQNTTSESVSFTLIWYNFNTSTVLGSTTAPLLPFASTYVGAKSTTGLSAGSLGSIKIIHNGAPGCIKANLTAVNTTGIGAHHSFNIVLAQQVEATGLEGP